MAVLVIVVFFVYSELKSRKMKWAGHVACMEEMRYVYKILAGIHEGKRPLAKLRRKSEDNIRMDLREIGWEVVDWIYLTQDRDQWRAVANTVMNLP
jgi:hypothetical protein